MDCYKTAISNFLHPSTLDGLKTKYDGENLSKSILTSGIFSRREVSFTEGLQTKSYAWQWWASLLLFLMIS